MVTISNLSFKGSEGTRLIDVKQNQHVYLDNVNTTGFGTIIDAGDGSQIDLNNVRFRELNGTGVKARNSGITGQNVTITGGDYGFDLLRGTSGNLFDSKFTMQDEDSLRFDREVLYGLHDVELESYRDRVRGRRVTEPSERQLNHIINTTNQRLRHEERVRKAKRGFQILTSAAGLYGISQNIPF